MVSVKIVNARFPILFKSIVPRGFAARSFGLRQKIDRHRSILPNARKKKNHQVPEVQTRHLRLGCEKQKSKTRKQQK